MAVSVDTNPNIVEVVRGKSWVTAVWIPAFAGMTVSVGSGLGRDGGVGGYELKHRGGRSGQVVGYRCMDPGFRRDGSVDRFLGSRDTLLT